MPQRNTPKLSLDTDIPAMRALMGVGAGAPTRGTAMAPGQDEGGPNPVLRRAVNDKMLQRMLQQLDEEMYQDTPQFVPAGAPAPGGGTTGESFAFRPRQGEQYGAEMRERDAGRIDRESIEALNSLFEPQVADRRRQIGSDNARQTARDASSNYWNYGEPVEEYKRQGEERLIRARGEANALDDAKRAEAQLEAARIKADVDLRNGKSPDQVIGELIANLSRSGAYGRSSTGAIQAPPPEIQGAASSVVGRLQAGSGRGGAATGPAAGALSPEIEAKIQRGLQMGAIKTREEGIAQLRDAGLLQ